MKRKQTSTILHGVTSNVILSSVTNMDYVDHVAPSICKLVLRQATVAR
jgi:hypothetical protein